MTKLWLDDETYCEVPITNGTHAYAASAEVMLRAWAIDDGAPRVQDVANGEPPSREMLEAIEDPAVEVWCHNSHFDRTVERHAGYPIPIPRIRDTMVQALSHGLPAGLGALCDVLKVPTDKAKDKDGRALIQLFCKPRPFSHRLTPDHFGGDRKAWKAAVEQTRANWQGRATRATHPAEWAKFVTYAGLDIEAMRECHKRMPVWNYQGAELTLWHLDQRINDRGVQMDVPLAHAALAAVDQTQRELAERTHEITGGQVASATKRDQMLAHILEAYGVDLPDMQMSTLERRIADPDLPPALRELLAIRLQASTTSTSKYKTLIKGTSADGRLRGLLQFNGAGRTGRWAGRLWQPQNLPRPALKQEQIDAGIDALMAGCADLVVDNVMELTSSAIRGTIIAPPGKKLVVADLSNIEGRDQSWLAGETWKLKAFRAFDAGTGHDLYKLAYGKSFGVAPEDVTKDQRQVGKVQELALGYEGGVGAFVTFAAAYNIDLEDLATKVLPNAPEWARSEANSFYAWTIKERRPTFGLSEQAFIACDVLKRVWREAHSNIAAHWAELKSAVMHVIEQPGITLPCGKVKVRRDGNWLRIGLPSGRALCYPSPQIVDGAITYMGLNQYSRKWCRLKTYGGKLFENVCQAVARDVMAHNMPGIEAAGYEIVLTVHDEVICEAPDSDEFNAEHLASLLAANPPWALDMPLAAAGFETYRYRKD